MIQDLYSDDYQASHRSSIRLRDMPSSERSCKALDGREPQNSVGVIHTQKFAANYMAEVMTEDG